MITIDVDAHKHAYMSVAPDERGRVAGQWCRENSAVRWDETTWWGIECGGCYSMPRP